MNLFTKQLRVVALVAMVAVGLVGCAVDVNDGGGTTNNYYTLSTTTYPVGYGRVSRDPDKSTYIDGEHVTVTARAIDGYEFVEWSGYVTSTNAVVTVTMNTNLTLTANFRVLPDEPGVGDRYKITFNANGGTVTHSSSQTDTDGRLSSLPAPTRIGYTFNGWYTASTGGTLVTTNMVFTTNTTIYAQWTGNIYTITFNANGGAVTPSSGQTSTDGRLLSLPEPTRSGYTFSGWYTASTGGTLVTTNTVFTTNATIHARWTAVITYDYVTINGQKWMKKNLNIETVGSWCYENSADSCAKHGRLYTWAAAMSACPLAGSDWRLPSNQEWQTLVEYAGGGYEVAGKKLKSTSGWGDPEDNGTDEYGFSGLPGGRRIDQRFINIDVYGIWWTATEYSSVSAYARLMASFRDYVYEEMKDKYDGYSVRCIKN